jgi:hypothetical protein
MAAKKWDEWENHGSGYIQTEGDFKRDLQNSATQAARQQLLQEQADRTGVNATAGGMTVKPREKTGGASSSSGSGGSVSAVSGDFLSTAKDAQGLAKDMAEFQVGINAKQGEQDFGFRDREAQRTQTFGLQNKEADFGNTQALQGQQIGGTQKLEETRQGSETGRLNSQLKNQRDMQDAEFGNQTNQRSQSASLALSGFKR